MLLNAATRGRSAEVMKRELVDVRSSNAARRSRGLMVMKHELEDAGLQMLLDAAGRWGR